MKAGSTPEQIEKMMNLVEKRGFTPHPIYGVERTVIGAIGGEDPSVLLDLKLEPTVEQVMPVRRPYKLVSRELCPEGSRVRLKPSVEIGGIGLVIAAGPCAVESTDQLQATAEAVSAGGAHILRGGAFKPRTSPYSFQGLAGEGLDLLARVKSVTGMPVVTEVVSPREVELVGEYADILQIGARNMQNFPLLQEVGKRGLPVLLKRGLAATVDEWLMAAEYILFEGNNNVILCERGIRTFETSTRFTLDLSVIPVIKSLSHLPVFVDPSHSSGDRRLVPALARAAVAAGCDGLLLEVHNNPEAALCDGPQSLTPQGFKHLMQELRLVAQAVGRRIA